VGVESDYIGIKVEPVGKSEQAVGIKDMADTGIDARLGLIPGDIIIDVDGKKVSDMFSFSVALEAAIQNKLIRLEMG
jgi:C-terminal processing protease CtpA/Prc